MIKINLLPKPQKSEGREPCGTKRGPRALGVAAFLVIIGMCWMWTLALNQELQTLLDHKVVKEQKLVELKKKEQQIQLIQDQYKVLLIRSDFIEQNLRKKFLPITFMDVISRNLDPLNLWLHRVSLNGMDVEIDGRGGNSEDIVQFVDSLEQSPIWQSLIAIETKPESIQGQSVYHFTLRFTIDS